MSPFYCSSARAFLLVYLGAITLPSASRAQQEIQCTSTDDPDFDFEAIVLDGFEIRWAMDTTADTITFEVLNSAQSWTSIGFSEDGAMVGSDAVIGLPEDMTVNEYSLTAQDVDSIDEFVDQEITSTSIEQDVDGTTITFTRPLTPANSEKQILSSTPGEESWIIWAFGTDNEFDYHGPQNREAFLLDLFCGETVSLDITIPPSVMPTTIPTNLPTQEGEEMTPGITPAPFSTPIPTTEAAVTMAPTVVTNTNPTASPTSGVIAPGTTPAPLPTLIPATEAAVTLAPDDVTTTNSTASPTSGGIAPGMTPAPLATPIPATEAAVTLAPDEVTTTNPTATPTSGVIAPGMTPAPLPTSVPATEDAVTLAPDEVPTANPTASPTSGVIAPGMTPVPSPTHIPATEAAVTSAPDEVTTTNPTATPTSGVIAPGMTSAPTVTPAPDEGSPDGNRAGGVHGSFRVGSSGGGWWVTASTGLSALLGVTLALSW